eukprot:COSAG02_NODE_2791_length_8022_cov_5.437208_8_plen_85_part_00
MDADIEAATAFANEYGSMPQLLTEYPPFDCDITSAAAKSGIGSSWCALSCCCSTRFTFCSHYSDRDITAPSFVEINQVALCGLL